MCGEGYRNRPLMRDYVKSVLYSVFHLLFYCLKLLRNCGFRGPVGQWSGGSVLLLSSVGVPVSGGTVLLWSGGLVVR